MKRFTPLVLVAGDVLALLLFVAIGQRDHDIVNPENPIGGLLLTAGEFVLPWLVVGWLVGAFAIAPGDSGTVSGRAIVLRAVNAWLIAAPLGILLRAAVLGRAVIPTLFMVVTMALGGAFVMAWRLLFFFVLWLVQRRTLRAKTAETG
jgi:hypothetical protein